jgi:hypothetical protein
VIFEHGDDICGYIQDSSDDFDWILASGESVTPGTGPPYDHTYMSPEGNYRGKTGRGNIHQQPCQ